MLSEGYRASMIAIVSPRNEKYVEANPKGCHKRKSVVTSSADDAKEKHRLLVQLTEELAQMVIADAKDDKAEDDTSKMPKLVADAKEGADDAKECAAAKKKPKKALPTAVKTPMPKKPPTPTNQEGGNTQPPSKKPTIQDDLAEYDDYLMNEFSTPKN